MNGLQRDSRECGDANQGDTGEHDAPQHLTVFEGDRHHLSRHPDRWKGVDDHGGHREGPTQPGPDTFWPAEIEFGVAVVNEQIYDGTECHRQCQQHTKRTDERRPGKQRDTPHRHPRCPCGQHRGGDTTGGSQQTERHQAVPGQEQIDHVGFAAADPAVAGERRHGERETAQPRIETGQRKAWEGDLTCTELQRGDSNRQPEPERNDRPEHETDPVHLEHLQ